MRLRRPTTLRFGCFVFWPASYVSAESWWWPPIGMGAFRLSASSGVSGELISHGSWMPLRGLSEAQVGTLVEKLVGSTPDARSVTAIHEASGGNPLMVNRAGFAVFPSKKAFFRRIVIGAVIGK